MAKIKLIIWDLDNTLWDGTVYYEDKENVKLKTGTDKTLKELNKRGIICSICSKNNYEDAEEMLKKFDILKWFKMPQISWKPKSEAIGELIERFGVQHDEVMFVDDDAFQRAEVQSQLPIKCLELNDPLDILSLPELMPENPTETDKKRVNVLKEQREREKAEKDFKGNYKDFLRSCNIKMKVRRIKEEDWPRITQLLNRTNELNATGNRYELKELKEKCEQHEDIVLVAELEDKFGEYGIIAEAIIEQREHYWFLNDITVSCRTMGRGIGGALIIAILQLADLYNIPRLEGYVRETKDNWRMTPLFEKRGFEKTGETKDRKFYRFNLRKKLVPDFPDYIRMEVDV